MVTIGFGTFSPASRIRMPRPPQNRTTFIGECPRAIESGHAHRHGPAAKIVVKPPLAKPCLDALQPGESVELFAGEAIAYVRLVELLDTALHRPLGAETRQVTADLVAVHAIAARVGAAALHVFHRAALDHV